LAKRTGTGRIGLCVTSVLIALHATPSMFIAP
jgi:hypothetical protein